MPPLFCVVDVRKNGTRRGAVRLVGRFDSSVAQIMPPLGKTKPASNEKARRLLGWSPRSGDNAVLATAESLVRLGLLARANAS